MATQQELDDVQEKIKLVEDEIEDEKRQTPVDRDMLRALRCELAELRKEKNRLAEGAAQQLAPPAGSAITTTEEQLRQLTEAVRQVTEQAVRQVTEAAQQVTEAVQQAAQQPAVEIKGFSEVGSTEAEQLLEQVGMVEVNGHEMDPINLPADTPECSPFNFDTFQSENAGTPALLKHHQAQLIRLGVRFGRGGYSMFDVHNMTALYTVRTSNTSYQGNIDGCVAPFGLAVTSAPKQCRVAYEHKQSPVQKQAYRDAHPQESLGTVRGTGNVCFSAICKGQAITATIGAYAYNNFPLMFDLTDGVVHHVLHVRGNELFEWTELTPTQAYYLQAKLLNDPDNHELLTRRSLALESIPEELQKPMKKLRSLRPSSALKEQLDSIVPELASDEEKLHVTRELMYEWACRGQLSMPAAVQAMYS